MTMTGMLCYSRATPDRINPVRAKACMNLTRVTSSLVFDVVQDAACSTIECEAMKHKMETMRDELKVCRFSTFVLQAVH